MIFSNIKKLVLPLAALAFFTACDKAVTTDQLADKGQQLVRIVTYGGTEGNYNNSALILDGTSVSETIEFQAEYVGSKVLDHDITVTVALNDAARVAYNAGITNAADRFEALPSSMFTLSNTSVVIKAGEVFSAPITLTFNPSLFDPAVNYMIPVTIQSISDPSLRVAPGSGTAYFHIFGNPLAGTYQSTGYVYHPSAPRGVSETKVLAPLSSSVLLCDFGDLGAAGYVAAFETDLTTNHVTITAAPGAAGAPYTQFDDELPSGNPGYTPAWPGSAQCNNTYDPVTKTFKVRYGYMGATGWRVTEEILVKQ